MATYKAEVCTAAYNTARPQRLTWQQRGEDVCAVLRRHQRQKSWSARRRFLHHENQSFNLCLLIYSEH